MDYESILTSFLETKSSLPKLVVIYGPTACGKTNLSLSVARELDTEIISTDSKQIYKNLDIGTGKILPDETKGIIHHMIDIKDASEVYSVGEFQREADKIIQELYKNNKVPVLCGGTGLYIDSIIYDFNIPKIPANETLRQSLEEEAEKYGNEHIYKHLQEIDPEYAAELHPNNLHYVIRGIEVKTLSGKSKLEFREKKSLKYDVLFLTPYDGDREKLYETINTRVQQMFDDGLVDEVRGLVDKYGVNAPGLQTIGYTEVVDYLQGNASLEECISLVQQHNRNYAKRQLTWFKKYEQK